MTPTASLGTVHDGHAFCDWQGLSLAIRTTKANLSITITQNATKQPSSGPYVPVLNGPTDSSQIITPTASLGTVHDGHVFCDRQGLSLAIRTTRANLRITIAPKHYQKQPSSGPFIPVPNGLVSFIIILITTDSSQLLNLNRFTYNNVYCGLNSVDFALQF